MAPSPRRQFELDVAAERPDYSRKSFLLTAATRRAIETAEAFLNSREAVLAICGPPASGKTHLAHILAAERGVEVIDARASRKADAEAFAVLDDIQGVTDAKALLRLVEAERGKGGKLVLSGRGSPADWSGGLRDLRTRLEAAPRVTLEEPDEDLLRAAIIEGFRRRQWRASPAVAPFAAPRIGRTFAAAKAFVEAAGAEAIATGRPITRPLARKVLANLSEAGPTA